MVPPPIIARDGDHPLRGLPGGARALVRIPGEVRRGTGRGGPIAGLEASTAGEIAATGSRGPAAPS
jgi:hypothetical protein